MEVSPLLADCLFVFVFAMSSSVSCPSSSGDYKGLYCQSCTMPIANDPEHGGTEKDGVTRSKKWCSLCYKQGEFVAKDCSLQEFRQIVNDKMKENGFGWLMRTYVWYSIPYLERWNGTYKPTN